MQLDGYLQQLNPHVKQMVSDLVKLGNVASEYNGVAPDLMQTFRNLETSARTTIEKRDAISQLFVTSTDTANVIRSFLADNEQRMITVVNTSASMYSLLDTYSPEFPCLFAGLNKLGNLTDTILRNHQFNLQVVIDANNQGGYKPGEAPRYITGYGPNCFGLPDNPAADRLERLLPDSAEVPLPQRRRRADERPVRAAQVAGNELLRDRAERHGLAGRERHGQHAHRAQLRHHSQEGAGHRDDARRAPAPRTGGEDPEMRGLLAPLIKLIVFLLVTSAATYVLAVTIANTSFGDTRTYKADFTDAQGLNVGDDVRIAGVRVGTVSSISIVRHNVAEVTFSVEKSRPLPDSAQIKMRYRNLVGQRYLDVSQGAGNSTKLQDPNVPIPTSRTTPPVDLTLLFAGFKPLFQGLDADQINKLSGAIISTLQGEGGSLQSLFNIVADLTNSLANRDKLIGDVINNLSSVLDTIGQRDTELSNLIIQLQGFISGLAHDRFTIGNAIGGINKLTTNTANLLTQARAPLARDIKDITGLVGVLNNNSGTLQFVINELPATIGPLVRTASYGSWFNFYLCSTSGTITLPGNKVMNIPLKPASKARCTSP